MLKLSVIIPTLNEAENIKKLIPFLFKQGGDFIHEILVVDGGSVDDTCHVFEAQCNCVLGDHGFTS